jgi:uncharacterized membrane protein YqgA involved in biofilm formation
MLSSPLTRAGADGLIGTWINFATVMVGGLLGLLIGARLSTSLKEAVIVAIGLMTIVLGLGPAERTANPLIPLLALVLGSMGGEAFDLDGRLNRMGDWLKRRFDPAEGNSNFTLAFVLASLQFCVGPLTILGSIQDGLFGDFRLLAIKSILDGFSALVYAGTFGVGTLFAGATILIVQGTLAGSARLLRPLLFSDLAHAAANAPRMIELSAVGGVILVGLALNILGLRKIKVANMLPALLIAPALVGGLEALGIPLDLGLGR